MKSFLQTVTSVAALLFAGTSWAGLIQPVQSSAQILIPAAVSSAGANGTFFRSDVTLINFGNRDQRVELRWLPAAGTAQPISRTITVTAGAGSVIRSSDFVLDYLGQTGLGAILITGVDAAGVLEPSARLYVATRVWTPQPGTTGTTSQSFPAVPLSDVRTEGSVFVPSMGAPNNSGSYRTNIGIVNVDPSNAQTFRVSWIPAGTPDKPIATTITVPPMSMVQGPFAPADLAGIENITTPGTRSTTWLAYGSTVDNVTGDAWSDLAVEAPTQ